jgi:U3-containing 90S pre-ribosomal complex subunit
MGGDDLTDDTYLRSSIREPDVEIGLGEVDSEQILKKRKRNDEDPTVSNVSQKSETKVLIESGRSVMNYPGDMQAKFLDTVINHYIQIRQGSISRSIKLHASSLVTCSKGSFCERLKSVVSRTRLKEWNVIGSPMVLIICLSARRAVEVLKEISPLKIRCGKFFAKHLSISAQKDMLKNQAYSIAVGTPNRLNALCDSESNENNSPMNLGNTKLLLLDTFVNQKGFTVFTLPDTAPDTADFFYNKVLSHMVSRKDIKIGFI